MCSEIRFRRAIKGWFVGCVTVTAVIYALLLGLVAIAPGGRSDLSIAAVLYIALVPPAPILVVICAVTGMPAAVVIWLSEKFRMRSLLFFGGAGGTIGVLRQGMLTRSFSTFTWFSVVLGILAGLGYWFVAERHTGRDGEPA